MDSNHNNFAPQTNASLSVSSGKKLSITPNAYDNQCSQFTLLDVTYTDPTDTTNLHVFHLYIPVLVNKVLYINLKQGFLQERITVHRIILSDRYKQKSLCNRRLQ